MADLTDGEQAYLEALDDAGAIHRDPGAGAFSRLQFDACVGQPTVACKHVALNHPSCQDCARWLPTFLPMEET